jgi:Fur family transcriptional regulator, ferric uptake regulator
MSSVSASQPRQRSTAQKRALAEALARSDRFLSAPEIHARLVERGERIGLATVYKQLAQLSAEGEVDTLRTASGENVYRSCATVEHHHHLLCRRCGRTQEFEAPEIESWAQALARRSGYADADHTIEITGVCRACRRMG